MTNKKSSYARRLLSLVLAATVALGPAITPAFAEGAAKGKDNSSTASPIKHVIVIVGENRSFDHLFATYVPKPGETVNNLLSEGIINADGTPGANYSQATQFQADITGSSTYQLSPMTGKTAYLTLPAPLAGGPTDVCIDNGMCNQGDAVSTEDGL